jgi:GR25 family glycosyltransferase involved in LPS biosynthesis
MKKFVISLTDENKERRSQITDSFENAGVEFNFFDATKGESLDSIWIDDNVSEIQKKKFYSGNHHWLTKNQLGCADSHRSLAFKLLNDDSCSSYLVFEDDVTIDSKFFKDLDLKYFFEDFDFILFYYSFDYKINLNFIKKLDSEYSLCQYPESNVMSACGYFINKKAAKAIVNSQYPKIKAGADNWNTIFDSTDVRRALIRPKPVSTGYFCSSIRATTRYRKILVYFLNFRVFRKIYEMRQRKT